MKYLEIRARIKHLKAKLQKHEGNDPQDWLDDERLEEIKDEIQKLEHGLECYFDDERQTNEG